MSRLRAIGALLACLLVVAVLNGFRGDGTAEPRDYYAGADGWAHAPSMSGRVVGARLARSLVRPEVADPLTTPAVFVVVELEVRVRDRVQPLQSLTLLTADGHSYRQLDDSGLSELSLTQAGWTSYGNAVFEMPAERVPGATLVVGAQTDMLVIYRARLAFRDVVGDLAVLDRIELAEARSEVTR